MVRVFHTHKSQNIAHAVNPLFIVQPRIVVGKLPGPIDSSWGISIKCEKCFGDPGEGGIWKKVQRVGKMVAEETQRWASNVLERDGNPYSSSWSRK